MASSFHAIGWQWKVKQRKTQDEIHGRETESFRSTTRRRLWAEWQGHGLHQSYDMDLDSLCYFHGSGEENNALETAGLFPFYHRTHVFDQH